MFVINSTRQTVIALMTLLKILHTIIFGQLQILKCDSKCVIIILGIKLQTFSNNWVDIFI